jgi:hypothetical protein
MAPRAQVAQVLQRSVCDCEGRSERESSCPAGHRHSSAFLREERMNINLRPVTISLPKLRRERLNVPYARPTYRKRAIQTIRGSRARVVSEKSSRQTKQALPHAEGCRLLGAHFK